MSASWVTFVFEAANFVLLAAVLGWLFFRPVREALERRRQELENERRAAAEARQQAEQERQGAASRRSELDRSVAEVRDRARREAEQEKQGILAEARAQIRREREAVAKELMVARGAGARDRSRDAAFAAREIVARLLQELEGPELEKMLLAAASRQLADLHSSGSLTPLVVESASALDGAAVAALAEAAGAGQPDLTCRVDPELIAGVRILTARGLVDVSVAGLASEAERLLLSHLESANGDGN